MSAKKHPDPTAFWETTPLAEMSREQWESLCDGCGKCCLNKLEDWDSGQYHDTDVVCFLMDHHSCRCKDYPNRSKRVPDCVTLTPDNIYDLDWMPKTCAYRLLAHEQALPEWHPLITGDPESVHRADQSVRGKVICETQVDDLASRIVIWMD